MLSHLVAATWEISALPNHTSELGHSCKKLINKNQHNNGSALLLLGGASQLELAFESTYRILIKTRLKKLNL